tara:strand:- start:3371 stop:3748 length:378 start_codon:yes stop_codon:yes gene_type:complete
MSSLTPGILVRSGSQQNPVVYGLQMQKDMYLTNLTIPFDQGLVLPKNAPFIPPKNGNAIIPVNSAATFEVNDLTVKGNFLPTQNTSIADAAFVASTGTAVNSGSTFDGYTLGQIVAILKVHGIVQ